jgi:hypothetical protein
MKAYNEAQPDFLDERNTASMWIPWIAGGSGRFTCNNGLYWNGELVMTTLVNDDRHKIILKYIETALNSDYKIRNNGRSI